MQTFVYISSKHCGVNIRSDRLDDTIRTNSHTIGLNEDMYTEVFVKYKYIELLTQA